MVFKRILQNVTCLTVFADERELEMQHGRGLPSNEAENGTDQSEGTCEINQEIEPGNDRRRGKYDGELGCRRTKLKEVVGG
jgi:hypothetical protein